MDFDPNAPFEVLGDAPAAPAQGGGFDPNAPFEVVGEGPQTQQRSRLGLNIEEGFRGTLAGEAVERTRSGQVAGFAADAAARAVREAEAAGSPAGLEQSNGAPSAYAGIPVERLRQLGLEAGANSAVRADVYRNQTIPQRETEAATVAPWNSGDLVDRGLQGATALAGQVLGSMGSPESFVGMGGARSARIAGETALPYLGRQLIESGAPNAVAGAAADIPVQVGEMGRGQRGEYSPLQTAGSAALGAVIGTGMPAVTDAVSRALGRLRGTNAPADPASATPDEMAVVWRDMEVQRAAEVQREAEAGIPTTDAQYSLAPQGEVNAASAADVPPPRPLEPSAHSEGAPAPDGQAASIAVAQEPVRGLPAEAAVAQGYDPQGRDGLREAQPVAVEPAPAVRADALPDAAVAPVVRPNSEATPLPRLDAAPPSRAQAQIDRIIARGEPAAGTPAAVQVERLRAHIPPVEGAPRADTAPPPPEPTLRPAPAQTTQGPTSADLPSTAPVSESAVPLTRAAEVLSPRPPGAEVTSAPVEPASVEAPAPRAPEPLTDRAKRFARMADSKEREASVLRESGDAAGARAATAKAAEYRAKAGEPNAPEPPRGGSRPAAERPTTDAAPPRSALNGSEPHVGRGARADDRASVLGRDEPGAPDAQPAGRGEADSADARTGGRLYSSPLDPGLAKRLIAYPVMAGVRSLRDTLQGSTAVRTVENTFRLLAHSNRAGMRALERRHENVPAIRQMADHLASDPGTARVVGETFQAASESRGKAMANRLTNQLGKKIDDAADGRIRDILTGKTRGTPEEAAVAKRVRALLDEQFDYLKKAGVDLGYVREKYFPRAYDTDAIVRDPEGFKVDATKVYAKMGLNAEQAALAADEWIGRFQGLGGAASYSNTPNGAFTKGRVLPPEADTLLAKWLVPSTRETLASYFQGTSRVAEFTRRFGKGGEKAEAAFREMRQAGVAPADIKLMRSFYESSTGQMKSSPPSPVQSLANWSQTIGTLAILPRAVLSSLVESMAVGARAGSVWKGLDSLATTYAQVLKSGTAAEARQMAEAFGIVSDAMTDMTLSSRFEMSGTSKTQQKLLTGMFSVTGLQQLTNMQRVAATKIGQGFVRQMVDEVASGASTKASASRLMAELGMNDAQAVAVSKWLKGNPTAGDMIGTGPEAQSFRTAITRFVNESIQNPEAVDKPALAGSVGGRAVYGITSFMFAFTRNVLMRSVKQGVEAATGEGLTGADRLRLAGPMMGLIALASAQYGVSEVRERLFNPQQKKERDRFLDTVLSLDRAGLFGTLSPIVNMVSSAKYSRDLSSIAVGPYNNFHLGNLQKLTSDLLPQPVGPNSRNTNNAEHAATRAAWAGIAAPGIVAALGVLGSAAPLPVKAAAGIGAMALSSPGASRLVADTVAGPKTARARTAGGSAQRGRSGF